MARDDARELALEAPGELAAEGAERHGQRGRGRGPRRRRRLGLRRGLARANRLEESAERAHEATDEILDETLAREGEEQGPHALDGLVHGLEHRPRGGAHEVLELGRHRAVGDSDARGARRRAQTGERGGEALLEAAGLLGDGLPGELGAEGGRVGPELRQGHAARRALLHDHRGGFRQSLNQARGGLDRAPVALAVGGDGGRGEGRVLVEGVPHALLEERELALPGVGRRGRRGPRGGGPRARRLLEASHEKRGKLGSEREGRLHVGLPEARALRRGARLRLGRLPGGPFLGALRRGGPRGGACDRRADQLAAARGKALEELLVVPLELHEEAHALAELAQGQGVVRH
mmetsp:Transcript_23907/g.80269  ORF Transcript_23907/g.80269 Transcript_23907/m.80269 type:complete len:349 (-) Transcript_23907:658-1704(-)